jgi:hypothetical protein
MIIAIQYYEGDRERSFSLARLLADLETDYRSDVLLALVAQHGTPASYSTDMTLCYCAKKFPVAHFISDRSGSGYPYVCGLMWLATMEHFSCLHDHGLVPHDAIFTVDGGDGVPLHYDWINMLKAEHEVTLASGKSITGTPYSLGGCPLHINPNMAMELKTWKEVPLLHEIPNPSMNCLSGTNLLLHYDIYHRRETVKRTNLSSVVRTDWQGGGRYVTPKLMRVLAGHSIWLHGYKDESLYEVAREHLFSGEKIPLSLFRFDLTELRLMEFHRSQAHSRRNNEV